MMDPFPLDSKVSTNWSNAWKYACYCAFMYTFTETHVCSMYFLYLVLTFDPTGKGSISYITELSHHNDCNFSWKYHTCNQHNTRLVLPDIIGYADDVTVGYFRIFSISRVAKEW